MQKYRVAIKGRNLLAEIDGVRDRLGFYTTVFVEALSVQDAEFRAIDMLREDTRLRDMALNAKDDPISFCAEDVSEIDSFEGMRLPRTGFTLFPQQETA
jgi:hypothetical protein